MPDEVDERTIVAGVGLIEPVNVPDSPIFEQERRWIPLAHEHEIEQKTPNAAIAIDDL